MFLKRTMRFDSCRKCGKELEISECCKVCMQPNEFHCKNCNIITDEQMHFTCKLNSMDQKLIKVSIKN